MMYLVLSYIGSELIILEAGLLRAYIQLLFLRNLVAYLQFQQDDTKL
jgi:hypothetical protein